MVDDVVATMEICRMLVAFDWHSTLMSGFVYMLFSLWFSVRLSG
jgi:hypothetical protein